MTLANNYLLIGSYNQNLGRCFPEISDFDKCGEVSGGGCRAGAAGAGAASARIGERVFRGQAQREQES